MPNNTISLNKAYESFSLELVSIFDELRISTDCIYCSVVIEEFPPDGKYPVYLDKTKAGDTVLPRWQGFGIRVSPASLRDPSADEAKVALGKIRESLVTAMSDKDLHCRRCSRTTPHTLVSRTPLQNDEYRDFYRCLECGLEEPFIDYPNRS